MPEEWKNNKSTKIVKALRGLWGGFCFFYFTTSFRKKIPIFKKAYLEFAAFLRIAIEKRIRDVIFDGVEKWKYMTRLMYFTPDLEV